MGLPYGKNPDGLLYANVSVAQNQTDTVLIAAQGASVKLRILKLVVTGPTTTNVTINSKPAGAGTALLGPLSYITGGATVLNDLDDAGWAIGNANEGLSVTTGAGGTTSIFAVLAPVIVPPP